MANSGNFNRKPVGDAGTDAVLALFSALVEHGIIPAHLAGTILDDTLASVPPKRADTARRSLDMQLEGLPGVLLAAAAARVRES